MKQLAYILISAVMLSTLAGCNKDKLDDTEEHNYYATQLEHGNVLMFVEAELSFNEQMFKDFVGEVELQYNELADKNSNIRAKANSSVKADIPVIPSLVSAYKNYQEAVNKELSGQQIGVIYTILFDQSVTPNDPAENAKYEEDKRLATQAARIPCFETFHDLKCMIENDCSWSWWTED